MSGMVGAVPAYVRHADPDVRARVALSRLAEPGDEAMGAAVLALGADETLARVRDGSLIGRRTPHYRSRLERLDVDSDLEVAARAGARVVVPGDEEWPPQLDDLGAARPLLLWAAGPGDLARITTRSVAVVGARACTPYGEHVAAELAAGLGDRGWTVVSGGAFGIDAAAHRGALAVDASTVAVLACGVDVAYPVAHHRLFAAIGETGALVSDLPPGARPTRGRFLDRNRLIAALTRGTVVVEAAVRSGARNTAGHAEGLSRPVMAVPGPVTSASSAGCHELVRVAGASLVTDASDVVDIVGELGGDAADARRGERRPHDDLDATTLRVREALPLRRWAAPDAVGRLAGLDPPTVLRALAVLAAAGLAESRDGAWRRVTDR
ncbi:MAG TPA: DNA-processing protein DprA [Actinomycetes bacterium]